MLLSICGSRTLKNPTADDIRAAVDSFDAKQEEAFVMLERPDGEFVHASGDCETGFDLECVEAGEHYFSQSKQASFEETLMTLISYAASAPDWRTHLAWKHFDDDEDFDNADEVECFGQYPTRDAHKILARLEECQIPFEVEFNAPAGSDTVSMFVRRKDFSRTRQIINESTR